jgi:hypothetical protein
VALNVRLIPLLRGLIVTVRHTLLSYIPVVKYRRGV